MVKRRELGQTIPPSFEGWSRRAGQVILSMNAKSPPADRPLGLSRGPAEPFPAIVTPMTKGPDLGWITSYIWEGADDMLPGRCPQVHSMFRDVTLPMTVLRRLEAVSEPTKRAVLDWKLALAAVLSSGRMSGDCRLHILLLRTPEASRGSSVRPVMPRLTERVALGMGMTRPEIRRGGSDDRSSERED